MNPRSSSAVIWGGFAGPPLGKTPWVSVALRGLAGVAGIGHLNLCVAGAPESCDPGWGAGRQPPCH